jgi:hypothetical protein
MAARRVSRSDETAEARHRRDAKHFRNLSARSTDAALKRMLAAIADLHDKIADHLARKKT